MLCMKLIESLVDRKGRLWLYSTGIGVIGILTAYGIITGEHATAWSALLAPLFGLAIANVPNEQEQE